MSDGHAIWRIEISRKLRPFKFHTKRGRDHTGKRRRTVPSPSWIQSTPFHRARSVGCRIRPRRGRDGQRQRLADLNTANFHAWWNGSPPRVVQVLVSGYGATDGGERAGAAVVTRQHALGPA